MLTEKVPWPLATNVGSYGARLVNHYSLYKLSHLDRRNPVLLPLPPSPLFSLYEAAQFLPVANLDPKPYSLHVCLQR